LQSTNNISFIHPKQCTFIQNIAMPTQDLVANQQLHPLKSKNILPNIPYKKNHPFEAKFCSKK